MSVLLAITKEGTDAINGYLANVSTDQFTEDVKELAKANADQDVIKEAILHLQALLK